MLNLYSKKTANSNHRLYARNGKSRREFHFPPLVIRLAGSEFDTAKKYLASLKTHSDALVVVENLDEAVEKAIRLAKSTAA